MAEINKLLSFWARDEDSRPHCEDKVSPVHAVGEVLYGYPAMGNPSTGFT